MGHELELASTKDLAAVWSGADGLADAYKRAVDGGVPAEVKRAAVEAVAMFAHLPSGQGIDHNLTALHLAGEMAARGIGPADLVEAIRRMRPVQHFRPTLPDFIRQFDALLSEARRLDLSRCMIHAVDPKGRAYTIRPEEVEAKKAQGWRIVHDPRERGAAASKNDVENTRKAMRRLFQHGIKNPEQS